MTLDDLTAPTSGTRRPEHAALAAALDARRPGHSLPAPLYTDPELHQLELDLLWGRQWIFVGTSADVPEPGDYITVDLGRASVLILRDDDEQVRAFHNVCRHRGARLVEDRGSVGNIVCGYHRWTYATDGRLVHAPQLGPGIDTSCLSLLSVHLREIGGLLFCCLAADPPADIDDVAEVLTPYLAPHRLAGAKVAAQIDLVEDGNWKLTMENNRECYHCDGHPDLLNTFFQTWGLEDHQIPDRLRAAHQRFLLADAELAQRCAALGLPYPVVEDLVERPFGFRVERSPLDQAGESFSLDGSRLVHRLLGDVDSFAMGRLGLHVQPNAWFHVLGDHAVTFAVFPRGVDQTLVRTTWLVDADAREGVDYDVDELTAVWRHTNEEDAAFVARAQRGVSDPAYVPGPYTETERQVDSFVTWFTTRMREEMAR
ncbi:aromatic ring-hydroxylating oxygenase subunit alpha [Aeromicrobium sp. CF3.5]|uniref:aromatic ring-hydroxylating oxygenase subunit alpha n=1 Tax=Aeromicrobium sp. CF3.5 TaxID=3373078 RepID=UPI003EE6D913